MSVVRPEFLKVLPADIARVGADAACVLALVRYVTALDGEHNGRLLIDGATWWQASYVDIGAALGGGMGRYSVRRIMVRLEDIGLLLSLTPGSSDGDQTKAYRIPSDQPMCDSATPLTSQCANPPRGVADSQQGCCDSALSSSTKELREELEEAPSLRSGGARARARARASSHPPTREEQGLHPLPESEWDEPPVHCPLHPDDTTAPCIPCKIQREENEAWWDSLDDREQQYWREHPDELATREAEEEQRRQARRSEPDPWADIEPARDLTALYGLNGQPAADRPGREETGAS